MLEPSEAPGDTPASHRSEGIVPQGTTELGVDIVKVDRIAAATLLDDRFEPPARTAPAGVFQPDDDDPRVVLELDASAAWVAEAYPVEDVETSADGRLRVRLAVAAEAWFERLLVGLGPQVRVIDAPASRATRPKLS